MPSIHVRRWIENLSDAGYELFWFDILNRGDEFLKAQSVSTFTSWKKRKLPYIKGEYWLSKKWPKIYRIIQPLLEVTENEAIENVLNDLQPDIVHSFEIHSACVPILNAMKKNKRQKWLYSCWGNDLFMASKNEIPLIRKVLERVNLLHTDCQRDCDLATKVGFKGTFTGVIPGGGGYAVQSFAEYKKDIATRKIILVKGYQHKFGRAMVVVKAMEEMLDKLKGWEVIFYGCHQEVRDYVNSNHLPFQTFGRHDLQHLDVIRLMGKARIAIGNSISDGMPNTLLEAIVLGAFPIQSNPGGASAEIIKHGINGLLIENPCNPSEIKKWVILALEDDQLIESASKINTEISKEKLDFEVLKSKIQNIYKKIHPCA